MSIRTKIDFSGITSDHIVTSNNKKYIHEDDEIFNSLKDEIAACENAQVQTEIATLEILDIKEQTKVIANDAIDTATERAETAAQNAETAQALAETAAINALEAERNVTEFSETFAKLDEDNEFSGNNNFTGTLSLNNKSVLTADDLSNYVTNDILSNKNYLTSSALTDYAKKTDLNSYATTSSLSSYIKTSTLKSYITATKQSGTSWYRKYSDGWIEQGGNFTCPADSFVKITYLSAFTNTNYSLLATARNPGGDRIFVKTRNINTTYAEIGSFSSNATFGTDISWYACGY